MSSARLHVDGPVDEDILLEAHETNVILQELLTELRKQTQPTYSASLSLRSVVAFMIFWTFLMVVPMLLGFLALVVMS